MNRFISHLVKLAVVSTAFLSCGPSKKVSFNITQPAQINLPSGVNTILLVDRTKFNNGVLNAIEGILTGELPGDDKGAAQEALNSLKNALDLSPRYKVKILPDRLSGNSMTATFPQTIPWNVIDSLCAANNADMVVALEVFDTDFIVTNGARQKKRTEGDGKNTREVSYTEYYAQGVGNIKMGIRSYNRNDHSIVDQQMLNRSNTWEGTGTSALDAAAALISKSRANKYLAKIVGEDYAYKISPMPVRVSRQFYGKSKHAPAVAEGARHADVDQWKEAINDWKNGIGNTPKKDAGKIAYNIAVGYEVIGEYGSALTWAQEAYTKYGNKEARQYVNVLQNRINDEKILRQQMNQ